MILWILGSAGIFLPLLLFFEWSDSLKGRLLTKPILSGLFILSAVTVAHPSQGYYLLILIGLIFCLGGDVALAVPGQNMFRLGLVSFLIGHVFYILAFFRIFPLNWYAAVSAVIVIGVGWVVYRWLRPHLGAMKVPVIVYIVVISLMLCGASLSLGAPGQAVQGKVLVFGGALLFYLSDLFVARQRFVRTQFLNRLLGLPLYFIGQFMLAFSVGIIH